MSTPNRPMTMGANQHHPVVDAEVLHGHPREDGTEHEQRAVREVDDVEQAEDHREPEAQDGIEGAVHQPQEELAQQAGKGNGHGEKITSRRRISSRPSW
jgi:hypothetical protein